MMAFAVRYLLFFTAMALGLWGFLALPLLWGVLCLVVGFLIGGIASMVAFKRLATEKQIKEDLEARLIDD
ncbi:MAG: hypothetical protein AAGE86_11945 [Pseudomonadota bacterium]